MRSHRNHGHVTLTRLSGDRIIWLYITCSSYLESHLSSRPSFVTRIYIYPVCLYVYVCTIRLRYRCAVGSCNATNCRHDWEEWEREREKEYYVGIQVFLNVSRKHSSIKVLPSYEENIFEVKLCDYYYRGRHSFYPRALLDYVEFFMFILIVLLPFLLIPYLSFQLRNDYLKIEIVCRSNIARTINSIEGGTIEERYARLSQPLLENEAIPRMYFSRER